MGSTGSNPMPNWTDSLPRRDFYNLPANNTNSLPRRDRAGLGRPEPPNRNPILTAGVGYESGQEHASNGAAHFASSNPPKRRDSSLNRENPFRDNLQTKGEKSLFFLDAVKMHNSGFRFHLKNMVQLENKREHKGHDLKVD
jgi:hypothetical protein